MNKKELIKSIKDNQVFICRKCVLNGLKNASLKNIKKLEQEGKSLTPCLISFLFILEKLFGEEKAPSIFLEIEEKVGVNFNETGFPCSKGKTMFDLVLKKIKIGMELE